MKSVTHNLKLTFIKKQDDAEETFSITTPVNVSKADVIAALHAEHKNLMYEFKGSHSLRGYHPRLLVKYVCKHNGWEYKVFQFDDYISFDAFDI